MSLNSPAISPCVSIAMVPISGPSGPHTVPPIEASSKAYGVALLTLSEAGAAPPPVQIRLQALGASPDEKEAAATSADSAVISIAGTGAPGSASIQLAEVRPLNGSVKAELQKHEGVEDLKKGLDEVKAERTPSMVSNIAKKVLLLVCIAALICGVVLSGGILGLALGITFAVAGTVGAGVTACVIDASDHKENKDAPKFKSMDDAFAAPGGQEKYNEEIKARMKFYKQAHDDNTTEAAKRKWKVTPEVYENIRAKEFVLKEIDDERARELKTLDHIPDVKKEKLLMEIEKTFAEKYKHARAKLDREEIDLFRDIGMVPKTPDELKGERLNPLLAAGKFHINKSSE